jgi:hypothetical protein
VEQQIDLFIQETESDLSVTSQDINLQLDQITVEYSAAVTENELFIENPAYELALSAVPEPGDMQIYEPWDKQGILNAFNAIKSALYQPTPVVNTYDEISEESLNRQKLALDNKLTLTMGFLEFLVGELTK